MSSDQYLFSRDFKASLRLNFNHWLFKGLVGYSLHPKIKFYEDVAIADLGTGTAIWLQELADKLPASVKLVGFDISADQFPPEAWRMPNVSLHAHDCLEPFPEEHVGKYDIVAIRFFRCVIRNGDPVPLLKNAMTLLKPGGYIQWLDVGGAKTHIYGNNDNSAAPMSEQLAKMSIRPSPDLDADWVGELPETFTKQGLSLVAKDRIPLRNAYRQPWGLSMFAGIEETSAKRGEEGMKQAKVFIDGLSKEMDRGILVEHPLVCVVGRKNA